MTTKRKKAKPVTGDARISRLQRARADVAAVQRVARVAELLSKGYRPTQAAVTVAEEFGVAERTAWSDLKKAQESLSKAFADELPQMKMQLRGYYGRMMVIAEEDRDVRGGVSAASGLAKLCGADEPSRLEVTSGVLLIPEGDDDYSQTTTLPKESK